MIRIKLLIFIVLVGLVTFLTGPSVNGILYAQWSRITTGGPIVHLKNASAIYEPNGNRMIVFGGRTTTGISDQMWSLNLANNQWSQIIPVGGPNPSARNTQNAYYDPISNAMIIWSGQGNAGNLLNDVWSYSLITNQWTVLWNDGNVSGAPLKRYGTASIFDPATRKITTFAGFTTSGRFEDTWTFDVSLNQWVERTNLPHPPKRCLHSGVYANDLGRFVIYGGQDTGPLDDIWQCNLSNFVWSDITPTVKPPARFWNSIIYYQGGNILIFGGLDNAARNDMWKFRMGSNTWESINQGSVIPGARWGHTGIYIPAQDRMIIFGGEGDSSYTDTWQYNNVSVIGIEPISNNIPGEFKLEQNYPNPFNPVTKIKFNIPLLSTTPSGRGVSEGRGVLLKIYDALGREVTTLVNEELKPGTYEIEWSAEGGAISYPSGVYFYQLETGSYKQTRKMILLK